MRLPSLTFVVLLGFAANSLLCRLALAEGTIGPALFTLVRLAAGAAVLLALAAALPGAGKPEGVARRRPTWPMALTLLLYIAPFSFAYVRLETGPGALILFAGVQVTMFAGALALGERPGARRWIGSATGLVGLAVLLLPGTSAPDLAGALLMTAAALGWGLFSLLGRDAGPPLAATAAAFARAAALAALPLAVLAVAEAEALPPAPRGLALAAASGGIASALGYALWYAVLPGLRASTAALAQLAVPLIALAGGFVALGETPSWRFAPAALLVLGGVALAALPGRRRPATSE